MSTEPPAATEQSLLSDTTHLITFAKQRAATALNAELTLLYWQASKRVSETVLQGDRASYGKQVISALSNSLRAVHGKGWSPHCLRFAEVFPDEPIVSALRRQLSWTHNPELGEQWLTIGALAV